MIGIFKGKFYGKLIHHSVYEDVLYMIQVNNNEYHLCKIDLVLRNVICKSKIDFLNEPSFLGIIDGKLYIRNKTDIYIYNMKDLRDSETFVGDIFLENKIHTSVKPNEMLKIKGNICYSYSADDFSDLNPDAVLEFKEGVTFSSSSTDNIIHFVNIETGEEILDIKYDCDNESIDDRHICVSSLMNCYFIYEDSLIVLDYGGYTKFNLTDNTFTVHMFPDTFVDVFSDLSYKCILSNNRKKIICCVYGIDVDSGSDSDSDDGENTTDGIYSYDLIEDKEKQLPLDIYEDVLVGNYNLINESITHVNYNGVDHYFRFETGEKGDNFDIYVDVKTLKKTSNVPGVEENDIIVKDKEENVVELPLNLMINRSNVIKKLLEDDPDKREIVLNCELEEGTLQLYKKFVESGNLFKSLITDNLLYYENQLRFYLSHEDLLSININDVKEVFKVCVELEDIDTDYVAEYIVKYVKNKDLTLGEMHKYVYLLEAKNCKTQLNALVNVISQK